MAKTYKICKKKKGKRKTSINAGDAMRPKGQCLDGKYLFKQESSEKIKHTLARKAE